MKKYRDELNQIHMSEELKQNIRNAVQDEMQPRQYHRRNHRYVWGCVTVCAMLLLCIGLYMLFDKPADVGEDMGQIAKNSGNTIHEESVTDSLKETEGKTGSAQDRILPDASYQPQIQSFMGGMGASEQVSIQKKKIRDMPYENAHLNITGALPVYKSLYGNVVNTESVSEAVRKKREEEAKHLLESVKKTPSRLLRITDAVADGNGDLRFIIETDLKEGTRTQQQNIAKELLHVYPQLFSFKRADMQTSCDIHMGNGLMVCQTDIFEADDHAKKGLLHQVIEGAVLCDAGNGVYYLSIPYSKKYKLLQEYTILSSEEAKEVMYQGGYYSILQSTEYSLKHLDILHVELTYGGRDYGYASYQPYVLPIYRFYAWETVKKKPVILEVPALYPQDLKEFKENKWYFHE